jgi:hypothetical protein
VRKAISEQVEMDLKGLRGPPADQKVLVISEYEALKFQNLLELVSIPL